MIFELAAEAKNHWSYRIPLALSPESQINLVWGGAWEPYFISTLGNFGKQPVLEKPLQCGRLKT